MGGSFTTSEDIPLINLAEDIEHDSFKGFMDCQQYKAPHMAIASRSSQTISKVKKGPFLTNAGVCTRHSTRLRPNILRNTNYHFT